MKGKVFVGLSGGVDSAVSAALLAREGYDVTGVFIKIWQPTFLECTWERDRIDAMRVAASLGIPFREIDLSVEYKKTVIDEMIDAYSRGTTPNPDISCNEHIKFGAFYAWARAEGAWHVSTGHYARIRKNGGAYQLLRGVDPEKDQSYFLYRISQTQLPHILFPIGAYTKSEVRSLARGLDLPVAAKHDSQGLCFVGAVSMKDFLARYVALERGDVIDEQNAVIGEHDGAALYTVGQRHGFTLFNTSEHSKPFFVIRIDAGNNTITVSNARKDTHVAAVQLDTPHWLADEQYDRPIGAQSRYREQPFNISLEVNEGVIARFHEPHAVSLGQSLVFYDGEKCLGGARMKAHCE